MMLIVDLSNAAFTFYLYFSELVMKAQKRKKRNDEMYSIILTDASIFQ